MMALGLVGCVSGGEGGKQVAAPSSSSAPGGAGVACAPAAPATAIVATGSAVSAAACRPLKSLPNDAMEMLSQTARAPYTKNVAVEFSGLVDTNAPLWRLLPTLSEAGHVTSIAPTYSQGAYGLMYGALVEKREREADGAATTSLHFGLATAPCAGGEHAWLGEFVPLARGRSGAITLIDSIWLSGQAPVTGLRVVTDTLPLPGIDQVRDTTEVFELVVGKARPGMPVIEPKGAEFGILGRVPGLAGQIAAPAGYSGPEPFQDILLFGSGFYPLGKGAAMLVYHRRGPKERRERDRATATKDKPVESPGFFPPSFRLAARMDDQGFTTDPSRVGVAYVIAIATNQPPAEVCDQQLSADTKFVCRTAHTHLERYVDGAEAQWFVGLYSDPESAQKVMDTYHIKGKVYATEPPPGVAPPAWRNGKPVPWVLEGRPPKPVKEPWGLGF